MIDCVEIDKFDLLRVTTLPIEFCSKLSARSETDFLFGEEMTMGGGVFLFGTNDSFDCLSSAGFLGMLQHNVE